jgi:aspartyl-tRNA(Asn)/glutamyl-tRNA(Gln) amidotransferase subunit C
MPISKDDVRYIAHLARIGLPEEELQHFREQLEGILAYVDKLKALDVEGVAPTAHALDLKNVGREDTSSASLDREDVLGCAPQRKGGFYGVPRVIE